VDLIHLLGVILLQFAILLLLQLFKSLELGVQLVVPRIKNSSLEEKCTGADYKTDYRQVTSVKDHILIFIKVHSTI